MLLLLKLALGTVASLGWWTWLGMQEMRAAPAGLPAKMRAHRPQESVRVQVVVFEDGRPVASPAVIVTPGLSGTASCQSAYAKCDLEAKLEQLLGEQLAVTLQCVVELPSGAVSRMDQNARVTSGTLSELATIKSSGHTYKVVASACRLGEADFAPERKVAGQPVTLTTVRTSVWGRSGPTPDARR